MTIGCSEASVESYFRQTFLRDLVHRNGRSPKARILYFLGGAAAIFAAGGFVPGGTLLRLKA
ncbi:MAG: hypothetical protein H6750_14765 [Nitrospiraceae bacterium]|nr:hypothetical protein [Nitrospiraceae bacterium]